MNSETRTGGCQCGAVRYEISGAPLMTAFCHCTLCRRANAAPVVAWAMIREDQLSFTSGVLAHYASSAEGQRGFCAACGTQIAFTATYLPGLVDVTIGSLDRPEALAPEFHYWDAERLSWMKHGDGLPAYPEFPPTGEES